MKVKDAIKTLEGLSGEGLFQKAKGLYRKEVDDLIKLRAGNNITSGVIESALKQVNDWFKKVTKNLPFSEADLPDKIVKWERGQIFADYNLIEPKILEWRERTQREKMRGTPFPMLAAMKPGDLDAASSFVLGGITASVKKYDEKRKGKLAEVAKMGRTECKFAQFGNKDEQAIMVHCEYQESFAMAGITLPTSTDDILFTCKLKKCALDEKSNS